LDDCFFLSKLLSFFLAGRSISGLAEVVHFRLQLKPFGSLTSPGGRLSNMISIEHNNQSPPVALGKDHGST